MVKYVNLSKYVLHMHVALMMFYRMNITTNYWLSTEILETGRIMNGKPDIANIKSVVNDFYDWLNRCAFGWSLIGAIKFQPMCMVSLWI